MDITNHSLFKKEMKQAEQTKRWVKDEFVEEKEDENQELYNDEDISIGSDSLQESCNYDNAIEFVESLIENDLNDPATMLRLADIARSLTGVERDIFYKKGSSMLGLSINNFKKQVNSYMKQLKHEKDGSVK